jgi:hypothetical protein
MYERKMDNGGVRPSGHEAIIEAAIARPKRRKEKKRFSNDSCRL